MKNPWMASLDMRDFPSLEALSEGLRAYVRNYNLSAHSSLKGSALHKGGKFIFGKSLIRDNLTIHLPTQALTEYNATAERKVYLFTGSKVTGGFCVTRRGLLKPSKLGHILTDNPALQNYQTAEGEFVKYKGRSYCWVNISENGVIQLNQQILDFLNLKIGMELLSIRSSDIAFTMGATGPLLERADNYEGKIPLY